MMNEEEKFDKLLRFKLSEREFPFDELNWEEAEQLIIRNETRRKTVRFTMIFSAGIVAGALMMLPFMLNNRNNSSGTVATNSAVIQNSVKQHSSTTSNGSIPTKTGHINITEKAPQPVQPAFVEKDIRTGTGGNYSKSSSMIAKVSGQHSAPLVAYVNQNTRSRKNQINATPGYLASVATLKGENASNNNHITDNAGSSSPNNNVPENPSPPHIPDKAGGTVVQDKIATHNNSNKNISLNTTSESNKNTITDNRNPGNNIAADTTPGTNKNISVIVSANSPASRKDTTHNDVLPPLLPGTTPRYVHSNYSSNIFSVYAGGDYSFGWKNEESAENGSAKQASGITPLAGIYYTHYFGNISASLGIGYSELNGMNKTYTSNILQYDFGANEMVTTVTPETVYYLAFPFKLQYDASSKDIVGINCNYLLMLTTYSTLTTYQQTYFSQTTISAEKQNGYTQGFSNAEWQLGLSYTRMITGRLGITAEIYHDLGYVENNSFSNLTQNTKNNGLRLILSYQLIH